MDFHCSTFQIAVFFHLSVHCKEGEGIQGNPAYPLHVAESQGGMIGNDFIVVSGFWNKWDQVTKEVHKLVS